MSPTDSAQRREEAMSELVMENATVVVDGTELSDRASSVSLGLSDATMNVAFFNDDDADRTDAVLWPLKQGADNFKMYVKASDGIPSAENPAYGLIARLVDYSPINGSVGENGSTNVAFRNGSTELGIVKMASPAELADFLYAFT
jgi:hypothetical protein